MNGDGKWKQMLAIIHTLISEIQNINNSEDLSKTYERHSSLKLLY